jgi:hypothetical protein
MLESISVLQALYAVMAELMDKPGQERIAGPGGIFAIYPKRRHFSGYRFGSIPTPIFPSRYQNALRSVKTMQNLSGIGGVKQPVSLLLGALNDISLANEPYNLLRSKLRIGPKGRSPVHIDHNNSMVI